MKIELPVKAIEPWKFLMPVISAQILNAWYSARILIRLSGKELTPEDDIRLEVQVWEDFAKIERHLKEIFRLDETDEASHQTSEPQEH